MQQRRERTPLINEDTRKMAWGLAPRVREVFANVRGWGNIRKRIEDSLPGDIRQRYMRLSEDDKVRFVRGVVLLLQQEIDKSQEGYIRHLWDAFARPETLHPEYHRAPSVMHIRTAKQDEQSGSFRSTRPGDPEWGDVRKLGAFEWFANMTTAPLRAATALVLAHTARGKTIGRESGTPTKVGSYAETYAADPSWGSVLEAHFPNAHPILRMVLGGIGNIVLDPLNLLGIAPVQKTAKIVKEATPKVVKGVVQQTGKTVEKTAKVIEKATPQPVKRAVGKAGETVARGVERGVQGAQNITRKTGEVAKNAYTKTAQRIERAVENAPDPIREKAQKVLDIAKRARQSLTRENIRNLPIEIQYRINKILEKEIVKPQTENLGVNTNLFDEAMYSHLEGESIIDKLEHALLIKKRDDWLRQHKQELRKQGLSPQEIQDEIDHYNLNPNEIPVSLSPQEKKKINQILSEWRRFSFPGQKINLERLFPPTSYFQNRDLTMRRVRWVHTKPDLASTYPNIFTLPADELIPYILRIYQDKIKDTLPSQTILSRLFRVWKTSKTAYNFPASTVRNFLQNFVFRWLTGDISADEIARGVVRSARLFATKEGRRAWFTEIKNFSRKGWTTEPESFLSVLKRIESFKKKNQSPTTQTHTPVPQSPLPINNPAAVEMNRILHYLSRLVRGLLQKVAESEKKKRPTDPINLIDRIVDFYNSADIAAARIMAKGVLPEKTKRLERFILTERFVPDYSRVPALFRSLSVSFMPFANWLWYALYGSWLGIRRVPHRWAKTLDMLYGGGFEQDVPSPKDDKATREHITIPGTGKEIRADLITPFELGAGSEIPIWALEQVPAVSLWREFNRQKSQNENLLKATLLTGVKQFLPPTITYYVPNIISPEPPKSPYSRLTKDQVDYLLGLIGIPVRPVDPLYDTRRKLQETKKELKP